MAKTITQEELDKIVVSIIKDLPEDEIIDTNDICKILMERNIIEAENSNDARLAILNTYKTTNFLKVFNIGVNEDIVITVIFKRVGKTKTNLI